MVKILLCFLLVSTLQAQVVFQKKIAELQDAEGLALLPDGGFVLAGLEANCIQMLRLDPSGNILWMRQACPVNAGLDISIGRIQLVADSGNPGGFLLLFRKGGFLSSPDNLLNLMKFAPDGNLLWETQLRPEKRYGPFTPGGQLSLTSSGVIWACHAMGFTDPLPEFNQALVFKINSNGQIVFRRFYKTDTPATANGLLAANEQEIYVYGGLGDATIDGYVMKINGLGEVVWAKRYAGLHILRDGARFPNGDLLMMAEHADAFVLLRLQPDGNLVWVMKFNEPLSLFHCAVAHEDAVWMTGRKPDGPAFFAQMETPSGQIIWAKTYETCTRFQTYSLGATQDGGLIWTQSGANGSRLVKSDQLGNISSECSSWNLQLPSTALLNSMVTPMVFEKNDRPISAPAPLFGLRAASLVVQDCCPSEFPVAYVELPDSVCAGATFSLHSAGNDCADSWSWNIEAASLLNAQAADFQDIVIDFPGVFPVSITETIGDCSETFTDSLRVVAPPKLNFFSSPDTLICPDAGFELRPDLSGLDTWVWSDGSTETTRLFDAPEAGLVHLKGYQGLCAIEDSIQILFGNCEPTRIYIPNAFSPNNDGYVDFWEIFAQNGVIPVACQVFDRWGNQCFESKSGAFPRWDGSLNGRPAPAGVYGWHLKFRNPEGHIETRKGDLLLIR